MRGRLEVVAIDPQCRQQQIGGEMRGKRVRQAKPGRQHRAEMARTQNPQGHIGAGRRHGDDALAGRRGREIALQFQHILGEAVRGVGRAAHGTHRRLIRAGRTPQAQIYAAGKQAFQRAELLGDDVGRMVRQHDAPCPHPDRACATSDIRDDNGRCRTCDPLHVVMLRDPDALVAPLLGVRGKIPRVVQSMAGVGAFGDADEFEEAEGGHGGVLRMGGFAERSSAKISVCSENFFGFVFCNCIRFCCFQRIPGRCSR